MLMPRPPRTENSSYFLLAVSAEELFGGGREVPAASTYQFGQGTTAQGTIRRCVLSSASTLARPPAVYTEIQSTKSRPPRLLDLRTTNRPFRLLRRKLPAEFKVDLFWTDSTIAPPQNQRFLQRTNERFGTAQHKESWYEIILSCIFLPAKDSYRPMSRDGKGHRISGDTAVGWLQNRRFG